MSNFCNSLEFVVRDDHLFPEKAILVILFVVSVLGIL